MDFDGILALANSAVGFVGNSADVAEKLRKVLKVGGEKGIPAAEVSELALDLTNKLVDTRLAQLKLLDALVDLKGQMAELDRRLELQRRYEPFETAGGTFVLALKAGNAGPEPPHYICPTCAEDGRRSFLQPKGTGKQCYPCQRFFPFVPDAGLSYTPVDRYDFNPLDDV